VSLRYINAPYLPYLNTQVTTESFLALEEEGFLSIMFFPAVHLKDEKIRVLVLTKKVERTIQENAGSSQSVLTSLVSWFPLRR
jgi:hypothetical protein